MKAKFKDVESDTEYVVQFENDRKLWSLQIANSPDAGIPKEDKKIFFGSEVWKLTCRRAVEILERSRDMLKSNVQKHIEAGDLIKVNELKYGKI